MKIETKEKGVKIDVTIISGTKSDTHTKQEKVILKSAGDILTEISEMNSTVVEKIEVSYAGHVYFHTTDGKRIDVYLKPKYSSKGEWLEVGHARIKKGKVVKGSYSSLIGEWRKETCPHCGKGAFEREDGFIKV